jgi:hypothetical protein
MTLHSLHFLVFRRKSATRGYISQTVQRPGSCQSFAPDAIGNQTSTTTDGTTVTKTQNSKNELTGVGLSALDYDSDGNTPSTRTATS